MKNYFVELNKNHPQLSRKSGTGFPGNHPQPLLENKEGSFANGNILANSNFIKPVILEEYLSASLPSLKKEACPVYTGGLGVVFFLLIFLPIFSLFAQPTDEQYAAAILDKAMGPIGSEEGNMAIYFEGVAYRIDKPVEIFTLPTYKVHRGGFMINDGKKFEIQLGIMKALCDGRIMVIIDEQSKSMVIDSVRESVPGFENETPDLQKLIKENFGEGMLTYEGKETIHGKACHRIKAAFPDDHAMHVLYWVEEKTNKLLLMADYQTGAYDVYWVSKVAKAPKNHIYKVNIPKRELDKLYGYEVHDLRFND